MEQKPHEQQHAIHVCYLHFVHVCLCIYIYVQQMYMTNASHAVCILKKLTKCVIVLFKT